MNENPLQKIQRITGFPKWVEENCILAGYRGSLAHGTYDKEVCDKDILGVVVPWPTHIFGLGKFDQVIWNKIEPWDIVLYELRKYINLLLKSNPNVLSLLFLQENNYLKRTELGELLINNREIFISKQCYKSFCGYAWGQFHRMKHINWSGMGEKRKKLVEQFGYDTKNASHLIRLLKMGIELLSTGELNVLRHDSQELLAIKRGEWSLAKVESEANRLFPLMEEALIKSSLPDKPDYHKAEAICMEIMKGFYKIKEEKK